MNIKTDIAQHIHNNGIASLGTNLFYQYMPDILAQDLVICAINTGGPSPDNELPLKKCTFQLYIRAINYETGMTALNALYTLFNRKIGTLVPNGTYFYRITAQSPGGPIGRNDNDRDEFSINFITWERE